MRHTLAHFRKLRESGEKIAMLTCYDASFAALCDQAGVDTLLVGDSLGMVVQGHDSTLPVTMEDMEYHVRMVARGSQKALLVADLPFASYQVSAEIAFANAARLMVAGAQMVKLEGGRVMADTVRFLVERGIPVCGHIGLIPQSVHQLGGYRVQGKGEEPARQLLEDARAIEQAGAAMVVLEAIPATLAKQVTEALSIPTIGIGAGKDCSGQVLVLHDMLDIYPGRKARFVRNFMAGAPSIAEAIRRYVEAVKAGAFPAPEHTF
ncbi:MAG TPA: 3-methyl-2-oxobutanoate hydroxymethyltransferase [Burkholderiales bacterium]|nr:3-methyl-2-oxobutanoate hydroxymethyltransferase [Burkholderiales bacterium]